MLSTSMNQFINRTKQEAKRVAARLRKLLRPKGKTGRGYFCSQKACVSLPHGARGPVERVKWSTPCWFLTVGSRAPRLLPFELCQNTPRDQKYATRPGKLAKRTLSAQKAAVRCEKSWLHYPLVKKPFLMDTPVAQGHNNTHDTPYAHHTVCGPSSPCTMPRPRHSSRVRLTQQFSVTLGTSLPVNSWRICCICRICSGLSGVNDEARRLICLISSSSPSAYCDEGTAKAFLSVAMHTLSDIGLRFVCGPSPQAHLATHAMPHGPLLLQVQRVERFP